MKKSNTLLTLLLAGVFSIGAQAQQPTPTQAPSNNPNRPVPNQTTNPSNTNNPTNAHPPTDSVTPPNPSRPVQPANDRSVDLSSEEKASLFDRMTEKDRIAAWKSAGHDLSKMSATERSDALTKISAQDRAAAYDKLSPQQQRDLSDKNRNTTKGTTK